MEQKLEGAIMKEKLKKSITGKYQGEEVDKYLKEIKEDYEQVISDQKNRILDLRNENDDLKKTIDALKEKEEIVLKTMMDARYASKHITEEAQKQAEIILLDAQTKKEILDKKSAEFTDAIVDLKLRVQNIMSKIDEEIRKISEMDFKSNCKLEPDANILSMQEQNSAQVIYGKVAMR